MLSFSNVLPTSWPRTTRLMVVIALSSLIFIVEIIVGFLSRSLVLIADAFHVINDLLGFIVILWSMKIAQKAADCGDLTNTDQALLPISSETRPSAKMLKGLKDRLSYGWNRAEVLSAFFNGSFLIALSVSIFLQALDRFVNPQNIENPLNVVIVGSVALALNATSAFIFHEHAHPDADSQEELRPVLASDGQHASHHHNRAPRNSSAPSRSLASMGVLVHILGDALNTLAVVVVGLITLFVKNEQVKYADPALSVAVAISIFTSSLPLLYNSAGILLQATPLRNPQKEILQDLLSLTGVEQVHDLHVWQIDEAKIVASAHIILPPSVSGDEAQARIAEDATLSQVRVCLHAWGIHSTTLQVEHCYQSQVDPEPEINSIADASSQLIHRKKNHSRIVHRGNTCLSTIDVNCLCEGEPSLRCCL